MPTKLCLRCGARVQWRNHRGAQSPREHCNCGGRLIGPANIRVPAEYAGQQMYYRDAYLHAIGRAEAWQWEEGTVERAAYEAGYRAGLEARS